MTFQHVSDFMEGNSTMELFRRARWRVGDPFLTNLQVQHCLWSPLRWNRTLGKSDANAGDLRQYMIAWLNFAIGLIGATHIQFCQPSWELRDLVFHSFEIMGPCSTCTNIRKVITPSCSHTFSRPLQQCMQLLGYNIGSIIISDFGNNIIVSWPSRCHWSCT